ncbi:hypothetical protein F4808DRAFT_343687 [Astrocystis sublimbata]|nr:hypothetical protein F4808DRAFT_343687 [Astrocystis sublimbata]
MSLASVEASASPAEPLSPEANAQTPTGPRSLTPIPETDTVSEVHAVRIEFHDNADLEVVIETSDGAPAVYMVCASALATASRMWRSMLGRDSGLNAKHGDLDTLTLSGSPDALAVLFHIVHYGFKHVPEEPTLDALYEMCTSACHYECTHILYPWAAQWSASLANFVGEAYCFTECHKALHVAWTFGDLKLFRETVDALIVSAKINGDGKIVNVSGQPLEDMLMPSDLFEVTVETRFSTITKMLDAVKRPIEALSSGSTERGTSCKVGKDSEACEAMMLGSVIPGLAKAGLFPIPEPEKFTGSIEFLKNNLDAIKIHPFVGKEWVPHMSHDNCNLGFRESVAACLQEMVVPLHPSIMCWMSRQADTCGIEATREMEVWRQKSAASSSEHVVDLDDTPTQHEIQEQRDSAGIDSNRPEEPESED